MILKKLKEDAESYLNHQIKDVVITVPAYFNQNQRNSTIKAGNIAGFKNIDIIDEPIAAAIAYAFDNNNNIINKKNICVFDLGGGTFDITILEINNNKFNVKTIGGDGHLGGEDFDNELIKFCIKEFNEQNKIDISSNKKALRRLKIECERVKKELSSMKESEIEIVALSEGKDFSTKIIRKDFETLCDKYFIKCITCLEKTIKESGISKDKIDNVLIVGGSTRIPKIQKMIKEFFNKKDIILKVIQPDEAIANGAVIKAYHNFNFIELKIVNVNPLSLDIITKSVLCVLLFLKIQFFQNKKI
jgi:L1 cell adhesion molecule like protein